MSLAGLCQEAKAGDSLVPVLPLSAVSPLHGGRSQHQNCLHCTWIYSFSCSEFSSPEWSQREDGTSPLASPHPEPSRPEWKPWSSSR